MLKLGSEIIEETDSERQKISKVGSLESEESESEKEKESEKSVESDYSTKNLEMELQVLRPVLSLERKLRIQNCPLKCAQSATAILKQQVKQFDPSDLEGLMKMNTLNQTINEILLQEVRREKKLVNVPCHVCIYDFYLGQNGQNQLTVNKYKRLIKTCLYYNERSVKTQLFAKFFRAEYDQQDYTAYKQLLEEVEIGKMKPVEGTRIR